MNILIKLAIGGVFSINELRTLVSIGFSGRAHQWAEQQYIHYKDHAYESRSKFLNKYKHSKEGVL